MLRAEISLRAHCVFHAHADAWTGSRHAEADELNSTVPHTERGTWYTSRGGCSVSWFLAAASHLSRLLYLPQQHCCCAVSLLLQHPSAVLAMLFAIDVRWRVSGSRNSGVVTVAQVAAGGAVGAVTCYTHTTRGEWRGQERHTYGVRSAACCSNCKISSTDPFTPALCLYSCAAACSCVAAPRPAWTPSASRPRPIAHRLAF